MGVFLYIPWFQLSQWDVPLLYLSGIVLGLCGLAALRPEWREQAFSTAGMAAVATVGAYFYGIDTVPVQPFGILVALGVLTGSRLAEWQGKQWGVRPSITADFITHVTVIGLVSCYVLNGLFYEFDELVAVVSEPMALGAGLIAGLFVFVQMSKEEEAGPQKGAIIAVAIAVAITAGVGSLIKSRWLGLSSFGGFLGAAFSVWVWKARRKLPALPLAELACWCFPAVWIFGRSGCFVVHDHPGAETTFFLGVENFHNNPGVIRHDLGLYEVLWALVVTALFFKLRHRQTRPTGFFVALLPLLYTPVRFGLDFLRATDVANPDNRFYGLTPAQYAAIGFFFFSVYFLRRVLRSDPPEIPDAMKWPIPEPEPEPAEAAPKKKKKKKGAKRKKAAS
ncbi:MAG: prolipoprotein diacylglyceryl transferase family protein [Myxococcota bacterium]